MCVCTKKTLRERERPKIHKIYMLQVMTYQILVQKTICFPVSI